MMATRLTAATALTHRGGSDGGGGDSRCLNRLTAAAALTHRGGSDGGDGDSRCLKSW